MVRENPREAIPSQVTHEATLETIDSQAPAPPPSSDYQRTLEGCSDPQLAQVPLTASPRPAAFPRKTREWFAVQLDGCRVKAHIYRRLDGSSPNFYVQFSFRGRQYDKTTKESEFVRAKLAAEKIVVATTQRALINAPKGRLDALVKQYLAETYPEQHPTPSVARPRYSTYSKLKSRLNSFSEWMGCDFDLGVLTITKSNELVQRYLDQLASRPYTPKTGTDEEKWAGKKRLSATLDGYRRALHGFWRWLILNGKVEWWEALNAEKFNPARRALLKLPPIIGKKQTQKRRGPKAKPGATPRWFVEGLMLLKQNPFITDAEVSRQVGVTKAALSQNAKWKAAREIARQCTPPTVRNVKLHGKKRELTNQYDDQFNDEVNDEEDSEA